jgi:hypothetical protein
MSRQEPAAGMPVHQVLMASTRCCELHSMHSAAMSLQTSQHTRLEYIRLPASIRCFSFLAALFVLLLAALTPLTSCCCAQCCALLLGLRCFRGLCWMLHSRPGGLSERRQHGRLRPTSTSGQAGQAHSGPAWASRAARQVGSRQQGRMCVALHCAAVDA